MIQNLVGVSGPYAYCMINGLGETLLWMNAHIRGRNVRLHNYNMMLSQNEQIASPTTNPIRINCDMMFNKVEALSRRTIGVQWCYGWEIMIVQLSSTCGILKQNETFTQYVYLIQIGCKSRQIIIVCGPG